MFRLLLWLIAALLLRGAVASAQYVTLTGTLQGANGLPAANYTLSLKPSQIFYIAGTGVVINTPIGCGTSTDGTVVGVPNPAHPAVVTKQFSGEMPPATYYVRFAWRDAFGNVTLPSTDQPVQLTSAGALIVSPPTSGVPAGVAGMDVYIGTVPGVGLLQGTSTGTGSYTQTVPIGSGAAASASNVTVCKVIANDAGWPTGTGYQVSLNDASGNTLPGYPMLWRLLGPNTTLNLSQGLPGYNGLVTYPSPILATPLNHATQSISGPLSLSGYNLQNIGSLGLGTNLPAWPIDVENGFINSNVGYLVNGLTGSAGQCLMSGGASGPDTWGACLTGVNQAYQKWFANSSPLTQRANAYFFSPLTATDDPAGNGTIIGLQNSGVTAGTYSNATVTVDAYGRVVGASNGPTSSNAIYHGSAVGCTTGSSSYSTCQTAIMWNTTMPNLPTSIVCTGHNASDPRAAILDTSSTTVTGTNVGTVTEGSLAVSFGSIYCIATP